MICDNPNLRHPINNIKNKTSLVLNIIKIWRQDLHRSFTRDNFINEEKKPGKVTMSVTTFWCFYC